MILGDGVNGRSIEFDPAHIASVLTEFLDGRWQPRPSALKNAIDSNAYAERLENYLLSACRES